MKHANISINKLIFAFLCLCFNFNIITVNFDKAGINKLTFVNNNQNDAFDVMIGFNLFNSKNSTAFFNIESFVLKPGTELSFDVASFQNSFDNLMIKNQEAIDEAIDSDNDIEQLKKIFGCIKSVYVNNRKTGEEAKLYVYESMDNILKIFILGPAHKALYDCFHIDFDAALDCKTIYYNDCVNNKRSNLYSLTLDSGVMPMDFIHKMRTIYQRFFPNVPNFENIVKLDSRPKIKKFLFQIWIGDKPLPDDYRNYQLKWIKNLPADWEYKLYTNEDVAKFEFSSPESLITYNSLPNSTAQSDLLRMEILNKYGGVYLDLDTEPFEPLDFLIFNFDFFGILYGPGHGGLFIDNYFIGSVPNHPIIQQAIKNIILLAKVPHELHPILYSSIIPFTRAVYQHIGNYETKDIILPVKYFNNHSTSIFSYGIHYPKRLWKK